MKLKMKQIFIAFLIFLLSLLFYIYSWKSPKEELNLQSAEMPESLVSIEDANFSDYFFNPENVPVIRGQILNLKEHENIDIKYIIPTNFSRITRYAKVDSAGYFNLKLDYAFPYQEIWLTIGNLYYGSIYACKSLQIELDANILRNNRTEYAGDGIRYLGVDGELNNYINTYRVYKKFRKSTNDSRISRLQRKDISYEDYLQRYNSLFSNLVEIDNAYIASHPLEYAWIIRNERLSDYYSKLPLFYRSKKDRKELIDQFINHRPLVMSNNSRNYYSRLVSYFYILAQKEYKYDLTDFFTYSKLNKEEKQVIDSLSSMLNNGSLGQHSDTLLIKKYAENAYKSLLDTIEQSTILFTFNFIDSTLQQEKADIVKFGWYDTYTSNQQKSKIVENEIKLVKTPWCLSVFNSIIQTKAHNQYSVNQMLKETSVDDLQLEEPYRKFPFGATLYITDSIDSKLLLAKIRNSFKNKSLLLDFWATWCGPCVKEFPYSIKMHDELKGMPIEFVYLCTSSKSNIETWEKKIKQHKIPGTHVFVQDKTIKELMNVFSIEGYPSYAFIKADGTYKPNAITRISLTDKTKIINLIDE